MLMVGWALLAIACGADRNSAASDNPNYDAVIGKIKSVLPPDWRIVETKPGELPDGHYWGLNYKGRKGVEVIIQGPQDEFFKWKDTSGKVHQEPLAKEALYLWLMPPEYRSSWLQPFIIDSPPQAKLFAGSAVRVYGGPSSFTGPVNSKRADWIIDHAEELGLTATEWSDVTGLSWATWKDDLLQALKDE
jgi:hypothetical protein